MTGYIGQLVVLRTRWHLNSMKLGVVLAQEKYPSDILLVMWNDGDGGVKLCYHLQDAILPVLLETLNMIGERLCNIK